jgi:STE24 endopeptidase
VSEIRHLRRDLAWDILRATQALGRSPNLKLKTRVGSALIFRLLVVCLFFSLGGVPLAFAQSPSVLSDASISPAFQQSQNAYTLSPERAAKAVAYARARHQLYFLNFAYSIVALLLLLRWRVAPKLRDWAERATQNRFLQAGIFAPLLLLTIGLLSLPGEMIGHWLARRFGQSIQGWGSWMLDWAKGELLGLALGVCLVWLFYGLIRRSPRRWWIYSWFASLPILVFLVFASPLVVEPLFFHFTPLATSDPELATQLERVVARAGQDIPETRMYVMNASSKLNALNAYVTGLGASERVVVWDTTIARMTAPEIVFVFGHEMGHYVLGHIREGIAFGAGVSLLFLFAGARLLQWAIGRWGRRWEIRGVDDWASLPAALLLFLMFDFAFTPVDNAYSRHLEHQADQYGLEVVHGILPDAPQVAAQSFQILGEVDLEEPNPSWLVKTWFYTHPSINERITFAHSYDPWDRGEAPAFVK